MIDYGQRIQDALGELADLPRMEQQRVVHYFNMFRHLSPKEQDCFIESIRNYPKLYSFCLSMQQEDEKRGINSCLI